MDEHKAMNDDDVKRETLTTRQGRPIIDNQNIKTIGNRAKSYVLLFRYATLSCRFQLLAASCSMHRKRKSTRTSIAGKWITAIRKKLEKTNISIMNLPCLVV